MPRFNYIARTRIGKKVKGALYASDQTDLGEKLGHLEMILISASVERVRLIKGGISAGSGKVLSFTLNLTALLKGGLSLVQALEALMQDTTDVVICSLVASIRDHISAGGSFKEALGLHPRSFSPLYRAIVESGEATGKLDASLENIGGYLEWLGGIQRKVVEMSVYPIILFTVMIGVVSVLVGYVIPRFQPLFRDMQIDLPLPTKIVLQVSQVFSQWWYVFFGSVIALAVTGFVLLKNKRVRWLFDKYKLRLPVVGDLIYKLCLARFARAMYLCLAGSIPMLRTLEMAEEIVGNSFLGGALRTVREGVNTGGELSVGLTLTKVFPPFVTRSVAIGEHAGRLPESFKRVCDFYDTEVPRIVQRLFTIIEPLVIVVMGTVVGGIAFAVFMPLIKIMQGVGR